jgi:drug/metabolite transporter (DMT)-like permease
MASLAGQVAPTATAALAVLAGSCFGAVPLLMIRSGCTPLSYVLLRSCTAAVVLLLVATGHASCSKLHCHSANKPTTRRNVLLGLACLFYSTFSLVYMSSFEALPSSLSTIIFNTYPLIVVTLSPLLEPKDLWPSRATAFIHMVAFVGLLIALADPAQSTSDAGTHNSLSMRDEANASGMPPGALDATVAVTSHGILLASAASVSFAGYTICASRAARHPSPLPSLLSAAVVNVGQAVILGGILASSRAFEELESAWALSWGLPSTSDAVAVAQLAGAVGAYVVAQAALFAALALATRPSAVTLFLYVEPILTVILGVAVLGEPFAWFQWLGLLLAVGALCVSSAIGHPQAKLSAGVVSK